MLLLYIYIYTICNVGLTKQPLCLNLRRSITHKDRQDRRKREKQNPGKCFYRGGNHIGAGMLAMPLAAAGVGFSVTLILLIGLWALMCYTALLLLEVYQHVPADTGLGTLAKRYLGRYGQWLTGFSMMFLMYALTAAYISGAGELLASSISDWTGISMSATAGVLLFTFVAGGVVCVGTSLVDLFNRFLFSAKIIFLVVMLVYCCRIFTK